jgi:hypothetical protein
MCRMSWNLGASTSRNPQGLSRDCFTSFLPFKYYYLHKSTVAQLLKAPQYMAGSSPEGGIEIFHWRNPSGRTMALGSSQPLTDMSTRNIWNEYQAYFLEDKGGRCVGLKTYHLHVPIFLKSGSLNLLQPSGIAYLMHSLMMNLSFFETCRTVIFLYIILIYLWMCK